MNEKSIFLEAIELTSADERAAFVQQACGDDRQLKESVEALLQSHEDSGDFLRRPHLESQAESESTNEASSETHDEEVELALDALADAEHPDSLGRIGHYEVLSVLGKGAMGVVLKALDTKLDRVVAVKVLSPAYSANATAAKRFLREARSAAAVTHPHVVTIHEAGSENRKNRSTPYLVMECVDGQTLQEKIELEGPLSIELVLRVGAQAARGLAAAHAHSIIHRDVKPGNILLECSGQQVKITDFGLARAIDDASVTKTGEVAGTPQFMSPEQAQGRPIDHRSDLFSLGSCLYAMCTGDSPFRGDSTIAVIRRVCDETPLPIQKANSEVPDELAEIINRLMEKDADRRFPTAQEVVERLDALALQLNSPGEVSPPTTAAKPAGAVRRRRQSVLAAVLVIVVALGLTEVTGITALWPIGSGRFATSTNGSTGADTRDSASFVPSSVELATEIAGESASNQPSDKIDTEVVDAPIAWSQPQRVGAPVDEGSDGNPCLSADRLTIVFTSRRLGYDGTGLWSAMRRSTGAAWDEPVLLGPAINPPASEGGPHLSPDGLTLCYHSSRAGGEGMTDLWISTRSDEGAPWSEPENFGRLLNSPDHEYSPHLSADALTLTFASFREGGYGKSDIWQSTRSAIDEPWGAPINLGPNVNSTVSDAAPHLSSDGLMLVFASDRDGGYGGRDVWLSTRPTKQAPWTEPVNLGPLVNTSLNEGSAWMSLEGDELYFQRAGTKGVRGIWHARRLTPYEILSSPDWRWSEPIHQGTVINSRAIETDPQLAPDGLSLFYASERFGGTKSILVSRRTSVGDAWAEPEQFLTDAGGVFLDSSGTTLLFDSARRGGYGSRDLWMMTRQSPGDDWSDAINLGPAVNSEGSEAHPTLSTDGLTLHFSSSRPGGFGRSDIWVCHRDSKDADWSAPKNLGTSINSPDGESSPSLTSDGRILLFNSNRNVSEAGSELYMCRRSSLDDAWSTPLRLPTPVNGRYVERAASISADGRTMVFASSRLDGMGSTDVWMTRRVPVEE